MARTVIMQVSTSIPANSSVANVLSGQKYERPPFDGYITWMETGSAAGLRSELNVNGQAVSDQLVVNAQNRVPVYPDDLQLDDIEAPSVGLIQLRVTNTTGGALTHVARIVITEYTGE